MTSYSENESYKHKCAKEVFQQWCNVWEDDHYVPTNFKTTDGEIRTIHWRCNRHECSVQEYPIVVNGEVNSVQNVWDELICDHPDIDLYPWEPYVPTYDECKKRGWSPLAVVDVVLYHKGIPAYFIEICHTNPVSDVKLERLKRAGVNNLIEISADWILTQVGIPEILNIKRWLL